MRLAFIYPEMLVGGRPLDFDAIDTSPRGTTGSEIQILSLAQEMAKRGHEVDLFIDQPQTPEKWGAVRVASTNLTSGAVWCAHYFATMASLDVNWFRGKVPSFTGKRIVFQQVNDFNYAAGPDYANFVDLFISPSDAHREHMEEVAPASRGKWKVLPNGCYPEAFKGGLELTTEYMIGGKEWIAPAPSPIGKIPGRVVYASSPDRGLHLLLQEWPKIKRAVPHATLKIFYYALDKWLSTWCPHAEDPNWSLFWKENWRRAKYVKAALEAFAQQPDGLGVEVVGGISRQALAAEFDAAEVLAYPCDVIAWTEGFSCATLEGCASGALPVIAGTDALGQIYRGAVPMVPGPARKNLPQWSDLVVKALTDRAWADGWRRRARTLAEEHSWPNQAAHLERLIGDLQ